MTLSRRTRLLILCGTAAAGVVAVFLFPPIPQDPAYNHFVDQRAWAGVPNAWNVLSNIPFLLVGALGLLWLFWPRREKACFGEPRERWAYAVFFIGVALTAFGSAYYHWSPNNATLVWDRIPMAIAFMGLLAAVISERVDLRAGFILLGPLVPAGVASVEYWHWTEFQGRSDLRAYVLVQYLSVFLLVIILFVYMPRYTRGGDFVVAIGLYALAKVFELTDAFFFSLGRVVSGHTLKQLAAAAALTWLLRMLWMRQPFAEVGGNRRFD